MRRPNKASSAGSSASAGQYANHWASHRLTFFFVALAITLTSAVWASGASASSSPPGRHYEQVSPAAKGDGDIVGEGHAIVASKMGDGVVFESGMVFGDAVGSGNVGRTAYLARRANGGGWSTHAITPRSQPDALQVLAASTKFGVFSSDLSTALVWGYDLPDVTDDTPNRENLYVLDTASGALRPVSISQVKPLVLSDFLDPNIWGVSDDAKHLAFVTKTQMLPDAPFKKSNVYQWDDGTLSVAGLLANGSAPAGGTTIDVKNVRSTMSADGSRLAFKSLTDSQLYLRIDGGRTAWISQPEGSDTSTPTGIAFQGMTPDGKNVFFVSDSPLLDSDTTPGPDLYRWTDSADPDNDANLTLITNDGFALSDTSFGAALVGMSDDGGTVYIHGGDNKLKVWNGGPATPRVIDPGIARSGYPQSQLTVLASQPGYGRVSADGNWLAYINDIDVGNDQLYVYSLRDDSTTCVSCPFDALLTPTVTGSSRVDYTTLRPRWLTNDGKVFFSSTGPLVPEDTNGVADVYEYDGPTGTLSLLSTGKGSDPAMFADASASGDDVFILTRQQLVRSDRDQYVDLYDVRVGAAPPEPPVDSAPPCEGDLCQGALSAPPADELLGSLLLDGDNTTGAGHPGLTVRHRAAFRGSTGALSVKLGAAGRLKWSGRGLAAGAVERGSAGTAKLQLRLGHRARKQLKRSGHYTTIVHLTFLAADGSKATGTIHVTFKAVTKKGR